MSENQEIGSLPTQKQVEWLRDNKPVIVERAWGHRPDQQDIDNTYTLEEDTKLVLLYAIMHKVTEAVDAMYPLRDDTWPHGRSLEYKRGTGYFWHSRDPQFAGQAGLYLGRGDGFPTRFRAELAALGAPEEVVND